MGMARLSNKDTTPAGILSNHAVCEVCKLAEHDYENGKKGRRKDSEQCNKPLDRYRTVFS